MNARYSLSSIRAIRFSLKGFGKLFNGAALKLVSVFKVKVPVHTVVLLYCNLLYHFTPYITVL